VAGKRVIRLGHDLDNEFLRDELSARDDGIVQCVGFLEVPDHTVGFGAWAERSASRELPWDSLTSERTSS
jgi:hypothetical protein